MWKTIIKVKIKHNYPHKKIDWSLITNLVLIVLVGKRIKRKNISSGDRLEAKRLELITIEGKIVSKIK
jgi:hypothetical protein